MKEICSACKLCVKDRKKARKRARTATGKTPLQNNPSMKRCDFYSGKILYKRRRPRRVIPPRPLSFSFRFCEKPDALHLSRIPWLRRVLHKPPWPCGKIRGRWGGTCHRAVHAVFLPEQRFSVQEVHVLIPILARIFVGRAYDAAPQIRLRFVFKIRLGHKQDGGLRLRRAECLVQRTVRSFQIFRIGCVVVVIADEGAAGQGTRDTLPSPAPLFRFR